MPMGRETQPGPLEATEPRVGSRALTQDRLAPAAAAHPDPAGPESPVHPPLTLSLLNALRDR